MGRSIRFVSLNACRMSPRDLERASRVGRFVAALAPDVVALQEIAEAPALEVASAAGMDHCTFSRHGPSHGRGVALLHRAPARQRSGTRLSARWGDDKGFVRASIPVSENTTLDVIGLHLDWISPRARARQIDALARALGPSEAPRVVLGDLNAMSLGALVRGEAADATVATLALALGVVPPETTLRTFPGRAPRFALDWILATPELAFGTTQVVPTRESDHAAVVADLHGAATSS